MSKIGKINISIPDKVKVALAGNILNIEGPLGKSTLDIDLEIFSLDIKEGKQVSIKPKEITNLIKSTVNAEVSPSQIVLKEDLNHQFH